MTGKAYISFKLCKYVPYPISSVRKMYMCAFAFLPFRKEFICNLCHI